MAMMCKGRWKRQQGQGTQEQQIFYSLVTKWGGKDAVLGYDSEHCKPPADQGLRTALFRAIDGQCVLSQLHRAFVKGSWVLRATNY